MDRKKMTWINLKRYWQVNWRLNSVPWSRRKRWGVAVLATGMILGVAWVLGMGWFGVVSFLGYSSNYLNQQVTGWEWLKSQTKEVRVDSRPFCRLNETYELRWNNRAYQPALVEDTAWCLGLRGNFLGNSSQVTVHVRLLQEPKETVILGLGKEIDQLMTEGSTQERYEVTSLVGIKNGLHYRAWVMKINEQLSMVVDYGGGNFEGDKSLLPLISQLELVPT